MRISIPRIRRVLLAALLVSAAVPAAQATNLTGTFRKPDGSPVNGRLILLLNQPARLGDGTAQVVPMVKIFAVTNGALQPGAFVYGNDVMLPAGTHYVARLVDTNNNVLFEQKWMITGTDLDLGTLTPTTIGVVVPDPVLKNASSEQVVEGPVTFNSPLSVFSLILHGNISPGSPGSYDLGSSELPWRQVHIKDLISGGPRPWIDVRAYGAVGNGVADDTAAIQSAIDAAPQFEPVIYLPGGAYKVSDTIRVTDRDRPRILGPGVLSPTTALAGKPVLEIRNSRDGTFEDFTIQGNSAGAPAAGIRLRTLDPPGPNFPSTHHTIRNVRVGSASSASIVNCVDTVGDVDQNNELHNIENLMCNNFTGAAVAIGHLNSIHIKIYGGAWSSNDSGADCIRTTGGTFSAYGTMCHTPGWNFNISGVQSHQHEVTNFHSEAGQKILLMNSTGNPQIVFNGYNLYGINTPGEQYLIDVQSANARVFFKNSRIDPGQPDQKFRFADVNSHASFEGNAIGVSTIEYAGVLTMVGNNYIAGATTLTSLDSGSRLRRFGESGGTVGGFQGTSIFHTRRGGTMSLLMRDGAEVGNRASLTTGEGFLALNFTQDGGTGRVAVGNSSGCNGDTILCAKAVDTSQPIFAVVDSAETKRIFQVGQAGTALGTGVQSWGYDASTTRIHTFVKHDASATAYVNYDLNFVTPAQFVSTVATGTAPLSVASTTLVSNLNAEKWNGKNAIDFSASLDFGSIAASACAELTITANGASANNPVIPSWPPGLEAGLLGNMRVSADNTITVRLCKITAGSVDPASATFAGRVVK